MFTVISKRDGRTVPYDRSKIEAAVFKAMDACSRGNHEEADRIAVLVEEQLAHQFENRAPGVEDIQDTVENVLMDSGYAFVARKYILYRAERTRVRELNTKLMKIYDELTFSDARNSDMKRDNANIDGDNPMGVMLKYGTEGAKDYYLKSLLTPEQAKAYSEGDRVKLAREMMGDFEGEIVRLDRRKGRAQIQYNFDGTTYKVWVGYEMIEDDAKPQFENQVENN